MERWFEFGESLYSFVFYSLSHWVALAVIAIVCAAVLGYGRSLSTRTADRLRKLLAVVLIIIDAALYVWYWTAHQWDPAYTLPLQLCGMTLILAIIMLLTKSYRLFEFVYFAGIGGALQALLTPAAILSGFPHFTFYYFFVAHGGIIISCLFLIAAYGFRPRLASIGSTMIMLNVLLVPVVIANQVTGGNYFFIARKPSEPSLIDYLGPWPWYIVTMEAVALVIFFLLWLPFARRRKSHA